MGWGWGLVRIGVCNVHATSKLQVATYNAQLLSHQTPPPPQKMGFGIEFLIT